jgi:ATP-dependent DNA helicase RecG
MMDWKENVLKALEASLYPIPTELNELDWKSGLSSNTDRLAQHISAFSNNKGGGAFVFGVHDDGSLFDIDQQEITRAIQTLGNIANNNLCHPIAIEHSVVEYKGHNLLFVYVPEQKDKPIHLRGKDIFNSYIRSAGQTVKMSRTQVRFMIATSEGLTFEKQSALANLTSDKLLDLLNYKSFYALLDKNLPSSEDAILNKMTEFNFCYNNKGLWTITNLGAILFANNLKDFPTLNDREVIVRRYEGKNNRQQLFEQHGVYGYAVGFEGLVDFVMKNTSTEEIDTRREFKPSYPRVALRELIANALVHQDFGIVGMPVTIEIFSNRITITNAGAPLNDINRLIDLPPQSRNEELAQTMFLLGICEKRGSGIDRAVAAIEEMELPAAKFTKSDQHTRVYLYPQKKVRDMTRMEKIDACYQHACLLYEDGEPINNQSVRKRFGLNKNDSSIASRIISDTVETGLIKPTDGESTSKKFMSYIPYYG